MAIRAVYSEPGFALQQVDAPIRKVRVTVTAVEPTVVDGLPLVRTIDVDPDADSWNIEVEVPSAAKRVSVSIELLDAQNSTQWSGRTEVGVFPAGAQQPVAEVPVFQGPLDNLAATSVSVSGPTAVGFGQSVELNATVQSNDPNANLVPVWTSLTPEVLQVTGNVLKATVKGLKAGEGRVAVVVGQQTAVHTLKVVAADLALSSTVSPSSPGVGQQVIWTLTLRNVGPDAATSPVVTNALPAGVTYVRHSGDGAFNALAGEWRPTAGLNGSSALSVGASRTVTITTTVDAGQAGRTITSGASPSATEADPNTGNNHASPASITVQDPKVDLVLSSSASPTDPAVGQQVTWTLTVTNLGPNGATNPVVSSALPTGVAYVRHSGDGAFSSGTGEWQPLAGFNGSATLAVGASRSVTITTTVGGDQAGKTIVSGAKVSATETDANPGNDHVSPATITVRKVGADLALNSSVSPTDAVVGQEVTWTLTLSNLGPETATDPVVVDALPAGVTYLSHSGEGTFNRFSGEWQPVTGVNGSATLAANQKRTVTITTTVNADQAGNTITNGASARARETDPNTSNNNDSPATVTVQKPGADLGLTSSVNKSSPAVGEQVVWTLSVTNYGPQVATNPVVTNALPAGVTYYMATGDGTFNSLTGQWQPMGVVNGSSTLAVGATRKISITTTVNGDQAGKTITNDAKSSAVEPDPNTGNDHVSPASFTVKSLQADLALTSGVNKSNPAVGEQVIWTLTVSNLGPQVATNPVVSNALPAGVTYVSYTGDGAFNSLTGQWQPMPLYNGSSTLPLNLTRTIAITTTVDAGQEGKTITNAATASALEGDPNPGNNNTSPASFTVKNLQADLALTSGVNKSNPAVGEQVVWTLTVTNYGPDGANNLLVSNALPAGVTYYSATGDGSFNSGTGQWQPMAGINGSTTLAMNATRTIDITATVDAGQEGNTITNAATASATETDPNPSNNHLSAASFTVKNLQADLALTSSVNKSNPAVGEQVVWTLTVTNYGPDGANNLLVSHALPAGVTYYSATGDGSFNSGTGQWQPMAGINGSTTLAMNATRTIDITATVDAGQEGNTITNAATASATETDPNPSNNHLSAASFTVKNLQADLALTSSVDDASPAVGGTVIWTLTVTNFGPDAATSPLVSSALPAGVTYVSHSGDGVFTSGTGEWQPIAGLNGSSTLAMNATRTIDITTTVDAGEEGNTIGNIATVSATETDPNTGNNHASPASITVQLNLDRSYSTAPNLTLVAGDGTAPSTTHTADATGLLDGLSGYTVTSAGSGLSTANGGSVDVTSTGGFVYYPPAGLTGGDSFSYTVTGGATGTVNVLFAAGSPRIWYFDPDASSGSGTSASPATHPNDVTVQPGDVLFLFSGSSSYTPMNVSSGLSLVGEAAGLVDPNFGPLVAPGTPPVIDAAGGRAIDARSSTGVVIAGVGVTGTAANSIGIDLTGSTGALVDGVGVENVNGKGVDITSTTNATIQNSVLNGNTDGIVGSGGTSGAALTLNVLDGNGPSYSGNGIYLVNPTGQLDLIDNQILNSGLENVFLNVSTTLSVTATGNTASGSASLNGVNLTVGNGGNVTANLQGNTFAFNPFHGLQVLTQGTGSADVTLGGTTPNDLSSNGGGLFLKQEGNGQIAVNANNNTLNGNNFFGISVGGGPPSPSGASGTVTGQISGNTITGVSSGDGITIQGDEALVYRLDILNNAITQVQSGAGLGLQSVFGTGEMSLLVQNNIIDLSGGNATPGAYFVGASVCLDVQGNTSTGGVSPLFDVQQAPGGLLNIAGLGSSTTNPATVSSFFGSQNPSVPLFNVNLNSGTATAVAAGTCGAP